MFLSKLFYKRCRACGVRTRLRRLGRVGATHPGPFRTLRYGLVHCPDCEVVYLDPAPTTADLDVLYQASDQFSDEHYTAPERIANMLEYYSHSLRVLQLLPQQQPRVLEVGAGYAWISRACKEIDPNIETTAQDVTPECADRCPWVDRYYVGRLEDMPETEAYDLASMTHVIEHLVDPAAMLSALAARLRHGGKIFVTAPYRPVAWTPEDGIEKWLQYSYLHVPAHVSYLSQAWFEKVAPRAGMRLTHWDARHEDGQAFEAVLEKP
ncbi:MAG TPA: methyltransferase domain-containing protein [Xanthomonadaceae bacterium]|nr:methyltransferase domain-containing protein [Xanthomonadaceae bacterium]